MTQSGDNSSQGTSVAEVKEQAVEQAHELKDTSVEHVSAVAQEAKEKAINVGHDVRRESWRTRETRKRVAWRRRCVTRDVSSTTWPTARSRVPSVRQRVSWPAAPTAWQVGSRKMASTVSPMTCVHSPSVSRSCSCSRRVPLASSSRGCFAVPDRRRAQLDPAPMPPSTGASVADRRKRDVPGNGGAVSETRASVPDQSLGELFSSLTTDLGALVRDEMQLAKVELKEDITKAGRAGGLFGGAALAGYMVVVLLSFAAAWGLAEVMAAGWAFLIVGVLWALVAGFLYLQGRQHMNQVNLKPEQTVETLKEDLQWAKSQKS